MKKRLYRPEMLSPASKIASILREKIRSGHYGVGERLENERELAEHFDVSRGTIRQTLLILASERLVIRQQGRGTFIADLAYAPAGKTQTSLIGAMVYEKEYYFGGILQGASSQAGQRGYILTTGSNETEASENHHVEAFISHGIHGVIISPKQAHSQNAYDRLIEKGIAVVMLDTLLPERNEDFVSVDNHQGTFLAAHYLIRQGHRRLAYLGHNYQRDFPCQTARIAGFRDACKLNGILVPEKWIIELPDETFSTDMLSIFGEINRPTAIVCYNDIWAMRAIKAARECGLSIPKDLSVIGFDDSYVARNHDIPITTVNPEPQEIGKVLVNLLIDKIENPTERPKRSILVSPHLVVRETTARA